MKHIEKGTAIKEFADFCEHEHPASWNDFHNSKRTPGLARMCRDYILMNEQSFLGGYTERFLLGNDNLHIDHFRKKGMNWPNDVTFDWNNFIVEDRNADYGACYKDLHTNDMSDYDLLLNPVTDYPEQMMTYEPNGTIVAKAGLSMEERQKVNFTICRFNLNHNKLRKMRENVIKIISGYESLSDDDIRNAMVESGFPTVVDWELSVRRELKE